MTEPISMDQVLIRKLSDIILANITNQHFGVRDLASEAGISRITLYRKIKSIKNKDTSQFIREIRLRRAMELLQQNAGTVSEIAFMVGFGDPYYFNKCFHEFFGFPPGKIRKEAVLKAEEIIPGVERETIEQKRTVWKIYVISFSGILLFLLLFVGYIILFNNSHAGGYNAVGRIEKSIGVLPFKNLTDSLGSPYFVDAIMEDVRDNLGKIHDLSVVSRTSTDQFRENILPISEIAQKLKVNYLVRTIYPFYFVLGNSRIT